MATSQDRFAEDMDRAVNALVCACGTEDAALAARFNAAVREEKAVTAQITRLSTALLDCAHFNAEALKHKELFATEAVRDGFFLALAEHATSSFSVRCLAAAMYCIVTGNDATVAHRRGVFATAEVQDKFFIRLAARATSADAAESLARAMWGIYTGNEAAAPRRRDGIVSDAIRDHFFLPLAKRATTAEASHWLARAMCCVTGSDDAAAARGRAIFAVEAVRDGFFLPLVKHATTAEAVEWLATAMTSVTVGSDAPNRKNIFATEPVRDSFFVSLVHHATTAAASAWLARALTYITRGSDAAALRRRAIFATAAFRDNFFQPLVQHVASPDGVHALAKALSTITQGDDVAAPQRKNTFATDTVRDGFFLPLVKYATTTEASGSLGTAMLNIISGEDVTAPRRRSLFATEAILESFLPLANHTAAHRSLTRLALALSRTADGRSAGVPRSERSSVANEPAVPNSGRMVTDTAPPTALPTAATASAARVSPRSADATPVSALQAALLEKLKVPFRADDAPVAHRRDFQRLAGELDATSLNERLTESGNVLVSAAVAAATAVLADPPDVVCCSPQVLREVNALRSRVEQVLSIFDAQLAAMRNQMATEDQNSDAAARLLTKAFEGQRRRLQGLLSTANSLFETAGISRWVEENEKDRMRARQFLERVSDNHPEHLNVASNAEAELDSRSAPTDVGC